MRFSISSYSGGVIGTEFYLILLFSTFTMQHTSCKPFAWTPFQEILIPLCSAGGGIRSLLNSPGDCIEQAGLRSIVIFIVTVWRPLVASVNLQPGTLPREGHRFWFLKTVISAPNTSLFWLTLYPWANRWAQCSPEGTGGSSRSQALWRTSCLAKAIAYLLGY